MPKSVVAIVGRPNVGKSTLFNHLIKKRKAIVEDTPGVTRDRLYAEVDWGGREFILVDTGGIEPEHPSSSRQAGSLGYQLVEAVQKQIREAMESANLLLLVLDVKEGLTSADKEVANLLRRTKKPVILTVNKVDNKRLEIKSLEFYNLGLGEPHLVSALHSLNMGELLDEVIAQLPKPKTPAKAGTEAKAQTAPSPPPTRVAIVGRPNVGKSSLLNAILGEERVVVDKAPGTTRDAIDTTFSKDNHHFILIDTAGIRKRKKVKSSIEYYSINRALKAIERSDVVLIVIDAKTGVEKQDQKIAHFSDEGGKAGVVVVNKWDLMEKTEERKQREEYIETIRKELHFIKYAEIIFVSAKTKQGVGKITPLVVKVREQHERRIATSLLNKVIESAKKKHQPKGGELKIYYVTQAETKPPTFVFQVNNPKLMHFSYRRYLENKIRAAFDFKGTPIRMKIKGRR